MIIRRLSYEPPCPYSTRTGSLIAKGVLAFFPPPYGCRKCEYKYPVPVRTSTSTSTYQYQYDYEYQYRYRVRVRVPVRYELNNKRCSPCPIRLASMLALFTSIIYILKSCRADLIRRQKMRINICNKLLRSISLFYKSGPPVQAYQAL